MALNEYGGLDRDARQLGDKVALLDVSVGRRITGRGMDDKLGCTVRVPQWEKRKGFGNFAFWKEPASEDDARARVLRGEGTAVMRTFRKWSVRWTVVEYAGVYPGEAEGRPGVETWQ